MLELNAKDGRLESEIIRTLLDFNMEKKRVQTIIEGMGNGVMVTNVDFEVIMHNPALMRLLDLREEIKTPMPVTEIIKEGALIQTLKRIVQGDVDQGVPVTQEIRIGQRILRAVSTPSLGIDRNVFLKISGTVTIFEDITVQKELDRMKSDFVDRVTHELRAPLISIRQLGNAIAEEVPGPLNPKQKMVVEMALKKLEDLLKLIDELQYQAKSRKENSSGPMHFPIWGK